MNAQLEGACQRVNFTRYLPGQTTDHYESFFVRANHPTRPLAFWIRYTLFSPHRHPENALGELWGDRLQWRNRTTRRRQDRNSFRAVYFQIRPVLRDGG